MTKQEIYTPGDYVQATKSLKKIFCVTEVNEKGIVLEKVNGIKLQAPQFFPFEAINYPTAFFHIDEDSDEFDEMIIKHEMLKYDAVLKSMSFDELLDEFATLID
jgi:hypothetical protein